MPDALCYTLAETAARFLGGAVGASTSRAEIKRLDRAEPLTAAERP